MFMRKDEYKLTMNIKTNNGKEKVSIICYNEEDVAEAGISLDNLIEHIRMALHGFGYNTDGLVYFNYDERKEIKEKYPELYNLIFN